ncbi:DNA-binding IclR family transcriptional regulator [Sphingomonas sp. BE270]|jgi:IclR family acetate operon transcriptional repressor|nr:IclR family transcriptional regulator [Sphingomonas sp. BE270]MDR7260053.1 DNA-binding IclR family transcriptional regulator [Sphingomonas sp. BE270]
MTQRAPTGVLPRILAMFELLADEPLGLPLATIADRLQMPRSATHRLLSDLIHHGYVRQVRDHGDYVLTTKLIAIGLSFLGASGIVDVAQPILDRVAEASGEFVRLSILDGDRLTWVARAQGARSGLRYDPEMGADARFSCTASGQAVLLTMSDDEALEVVARQGFGKAEEYGPNAPATATALMKALRLARTRGFSVTVETFTPGMAALAAPVRKRGEAPIGAISVAGPHVRFTEERMLALGPDLLIAADELAAASSASPLLSSRRPQPGEPHGLARL